MSSLYDVVKDRFNKQISKSFLPGLKDLLMGVIIGTNTSEDNTASAKKKRKVL